MKHHLFIAGFASLAVLATPLIATGAMAMQPDKTATHHAKKMDKKTAPATSASTSATPATTPATPAPVKK